MTQREREVIELHNTLKRHCTDPASYSLAIAICMNAAVYGLYGTALREALVKFLRAIDEVHLLEDAEKAAGGSA
jgi:hypothetical protein